MGIFITIIIFAVAFITLAVAGGYATSAASKVTKIPNWKSNKDLKSAHKYLSIAAVVTWITVALIITLGILYLIFGLETAATFGNLVVYGLLFLSLIAVIIVGILSAIASAKINQAKVKDNKGSRSHAIIAAILAIIAGIGLLVLVLVRLFSPSKKKDEGSGGLFGGINPSELEMLI